MTGEDFTSRFVRHMTIIAGPKFPDGSSVEKYAMEKARDYIDTDTARREGPVYCAELEYSILK